MGCIAGAMLISEYERLLQEAGFNAVVVSETGADLNVYAQAGSGGCCSAEPASVVAVLQSALQRQQQQEVSVHDGLAQVLRDFDANAYAASVRVYATAEFAQCVATAHK